MPDHDGSLTVPDRIFDSAPEAFGLTWEYDSAVTGGRRVFIATANSGAFADAYDRCRSEMRALGYSRAEPYPGDRFTGTGPCFWLSPAGWSPADLEATKALVPVRIRESRERDARIMAERAARAEAEVRANETFIEDAKSSARRSLGTRRWAWVRPVDIEEAESLIMDPSLGIPGARRLLDLLKRATANVMRTEERVAIPYGPELVRAGDPAIRIAAAEALAHVTALDADRASRRNDVGWSRATTLAGHVLTGKGDLDEAHASHALRILRLHHVQVPPTLRDRLFNVMAVAA